MENKKEHVKKVTMPHILVLFPIIIIVFSLLTYVLPGGSYELDSAGKVIAGTFTPAEAVPFSPWKALLSVRSGIIAQASMISQMLVIGGAISVVLATECFENIMNYAVYKLQDKSVKILVPCIVTMMSLLGAFAGSDSMIIFVTVGILICRKLKLDRICAMAMFYLGYLIGQGASITSTVLINVQTMAEVPPLSDMAVRVPIWIIFTAVNAFYCTRYALKVYHDPNRSLLGCVLEETEDMGEIKEMKTPVTSIVLAVLMFATYVLYAIGGKNWGWGLDYLFALVILLAIACPPTRPRRPTSKARRAWAASAWSSAWPRSSAPSSRRAPPSTGWLRSPPTPSASWAPSARSSPSMSSSCSSTCSSPAPPPRLRSSCRCSAPSATCSASRAVCWSPST